jgi:rubrerythrin
VTARGKDYGHSLAVVTALRARAKVNREQGREIYPGATDEAADAEFAAIRAATWECRECGTTMTLPPGDEWPRESACGHSFSWSYFRRPDEA